MKPKTKAKRLPATNLREVIIVGGGLAGLSAAIYLGRDERDTLVIDAGHSMARWEPEVENYLGFPDGIAGDDLLKFGRKQSRRYAVDFANDEIVSVRKTKHAFILRGKKRRYRARSLLLATGIFHIPPAIPDVRECLGHSMFFCKDCDGFRVRGKRIAIVGANNEAVEYALGLLYYSPSVIVTPNGESPQWDRKHANWLREYEIPMRPEKIRKVKHRGRKIRALVFGEADEVKIDYIFTTRGDIFHSELATQLGAQLDSDGEIKIDHCMRTTVKRLYAAGCVTPANCQMIIAAGQGAAAAQAINRDLFEASLRDHELRRFREGQIDKRTRHPEGSRGIPWRCR